MLVAHGYTWVLGMSRTVAYPDRLAQTGEVVKSDDPGRLGILNGFA
ncbi:MAG TPA: hypothetical protein VGL99_28830 [Chloroflexota bacterium]|jgi:hypothetical protein